MAGVSIDINDRKRAEERRGLMADELNHRVKNSMATIQSIVHQTLRSAGSLSEARDVIDARLLSLAEAHNVLTRESWEGANLSDVVDRALAPFRVTFGQRFRVGGPAVRLTPRLALAFAMAVHELVTNALKYGALSNDKGCIVLNWDIRDGRLRFSWEERDGPAVEPPKSLGFGSRMIERALAAETGGSAKLDYRPRGILFTADAPLSS